jgi:hypothetical protein
LASADRAFAVAAAQTDAISAISAITAMLAANVTIPTPRRQFARSRAEVGPWWYIAE